MVFLRIKTMTRRGQIRKGAKNSYHFLQDQFTQVLDPEDVKYFTEVEGKLFDVSEDGKDVQEKTAVAVATSVKAGITKDEAYALTKEQQVEEIIKLGKNPKDYPKEADRVKAILEGYGGK